MKPEPGFGHQEKSWNPGEPAVLGASCEQWRSVFVILNTEGFIRIDGEALLPLTRKYNL